MEPERAWNYWIDMAAYDLETAKPMLKTERLLYVGFMAHQALEKALKAHQWYGRKSEPPYSHDLWNLVRSSGLVVEEEGWMAELIDELQPLNIEARYPRDKDALLLRLTPGFCTTLIERSGRMIEWIKTRP
jgi:HEPN domain-containing protein